MIFYRIVLLLLISQSIYSQSPTVVVEQDSGVIPFEFIKNKIIVPVSIEGVSYRFLLDTGGIFGVSEKVKAAHQLESGVSKTVSDINKNEFDIPTVVVPKVSIGGLDFIARTAIIEDLVTIYPYSCFEVDGMIGRDFFDGLILSFDWANKQFQLSNQEANFNLNEADRTAMRLSRRGLPDVLLKINGQQEYVEFDAGSGDFFSYQTKAAKKLKVKNKQDKLCFEGVFSFGITMDAVKTTKRYVIRVNELELANRRFKNFYSDLSKATEPRIGADLLNYGRVTVDYKNKYFYFAPYPTEERATDFSTFGFDIAKIKGIYMIKWILKDSVADKEQLTSGDVVLSINGVPVEEVANGCEGYLNGYAFHDLEEIELEISPKAGEKKKIQLKKMKL